MGNLYILEGKTPVKVATVEEWAQKFDQKTKIIKQDYFGKTKVSTVFLGIDHAFCEGKPVLFETMIFGGKLDLFQER